jgi:hypothetical protein
VSSDSSISALKKEIFKSLRDVGFDHKEKGEG